VVGASLDVNRFDMVNANGGALGKKVAEAVGRSDGRQVPEEWVALGEPAVTQRVMLPHVMVTVDDFERLLRCSHGGATQRQSTAIKQSQATH